MKKRGRDERKKKRVVVGKGNLGYAAEVERDREDVVDTVAVEDTVAVVDRLLAVDTAEGMKKDFEEEDNLDLSSTRNLLELGSSPFQQEHLPSYFPSNSEVLRES